jgi:hypothetical protein
LTPRPKDDTFKTSRSFPSDEPGPSGARVPEWCPMSRLRTANSPIHGAGVISAAPFAPGGVVLRIDDSRVVTDAEPLDPKKGEFEHHCDYLAGEKVVLLQPPERFINHACDPNTDAAKAPVPPPRSLHGGGAAARRVRYQKRATSVVPSSSPR